MNIGWGECLLLAGVVLLLFGARRLPELGKSLGEAIREFQRATRGAPDKQKKKKAN